MAAAIASLSYVFWCVGAMEMIERLAYYGVRTVSGLYAKAPASEGGLGITPSQLGTIYFFWAIAQNAVSALTGGMADRYGYKRMIGISTAVKIAGYLTMAALPSYGGFAAGAILLAVGTAIFKPALQGTLVQSTNRKNSSLAWGVFYQTVNIGGFIGPLVAGYMRKMDWRYVFLTNAGVICLNFLMLLAYREPRGAGGEAPTEGARRPSLLRESLGELGRPHVFVYLIIFSGFWFMFYGFFDLLPLHVDDWIDTRPVVATLFGPDGTQNPVAKFFFILNKTGTEMQPEGVVDLNSLLIMTVCFVVAALTAKLRATVSIFLGTALAALAFILFGATVTGWLVVMGVFLFSLGEMLSSPKFLEYIGNFAPRDKKAMYLGFAQIPIMVGMMLEGKIGPVLYDHFASKERFARELLMERGQTAQAVALIPQGEAFGRLVEQTHLDRWQVTANLAARHPIGVPWTMMALIGFVAAVAMLFYGRWVAKRTTA